MKTEQEEKREQIEIEDIIASPSPVERKKTGGNLKNKLAVMTRSGWVGL